MARPLHPIRHAAHSTFSFRESALSAWDSVVFTLNIGVPALAGWWGGAVELGLMGAILGLFFSTSDPQGSLAERLAQLGRASLTILVFGIIGNVIGGYSALFWVVFLGLTVGVAYLSLSGNGNTAILRFGALAIVSTAGLPHLGLAALQMLVLAALTSALTRAVGHRVSPDASTVLPVMQPREPPDNWTSFRYCLAYAGAVALGLIFGQWRDLARPMWVATTVLLVLQPDPKTSYQRIVQRIVGTAVGVIAATLTVHYLHSGPLLALAVLAISCVLPHGSTRNYWLHSAFTAWLLLTLYDFAQGGQNFNHHLLRERVSDVFIGCLLSLAVILIAFPPLKKRPAMLEHGA